MQVFIFQSDKDGGLVGYTTKRDSSILPAEYKPWSGGEQSSLERGAPLAGVGAADQVIDDIEEFGYCVTRKLGSNMTRQLLPRP